MANQLVLASQSPRRKSLLQQLGYQFSTDSPDIDETHKTGESALTYVERMAIEKAEVVQRKYPDDTCILAADTCVVIGDEILGKPRDLNECIEHLQKLSNNSHVVHTAIAIVKNGQKYSKVVSSKVSFKALTLKEIENYWQTGEPQDKAGSYAIQGIGGQFVTHMAGSYSAIVGLPLYETAQLLTSVKLPTAIQAL